MTKSVDLATQRLHFCFFNLTKVFHFQMKSCVRSVLPQWLSHTRDADIRRANQHGELHVSEVHRTGGTTHQRFRLQAQQLMAELPQQQRHWHYLRPCACKSCFCATAPEKDWKCYRNGCRLGLGTYFISGDLKSLEWIRVSWSLSCRYHRVCSSVSLVHGLIICRWMAIRPPYSMISMARSVSTLEPFWSKRTTGSCVTPTALMCQTGRLLSAVATTRRSVGGLQIVRPLAHILSITYNP